MNKTWRRIKIIIMTIVILGVLFVSGLSLSLNYVDKMWYAIPSNSSRTEVREVLKHFKENKVSIADVPHGFQYGIAKIPKNSIYRYDFLGWSALSIHVVYDGHGHIQRNIPTYE